MSLDVLSRGATVVGAGVQRHSPFPGRTAC